MLFNDTQQAEFVKLLDGIKSVPQEMKALYNLDLEAELCVQLTDLCRFFHRELKFSKFFFAMVAAQYTYLSSLSTPSSFDVDLRDQLEEVLVSWRDTYAQGSDGYETVSDILALKNC